MTRGIKKVLSPEMREELLSILKTRFEKNMKRHKGLEWATVQKKAGWLMMKNYGRSVKWKEPEVNLMLLVMIKRPGNSFFMIVQWKVQKTAEVFVTTVKHWNHRKENKPRNNALDLAAAMGIELLTEEQYRELQKIGNFDSKTSSWLSTPNDIRELGGSIFGDFRFGKVFVYHNGAESYYAARGFPWFTQGLNFGQAAK